MDLESLRTQVERFYREIEREYYNNWTGISKELHTEGIFERYRELFGLELIKKLALLREKNEAYWRFYSFSVGGYLDNEVKELTDRYETLESKIEVRVGDERIPYRMISVIMRNTPEREKRSWIYHEMNKILDWEINPILEERMMKLHRTVERLGYRNYRELSADILGVDLFYVRELTDRLSIETREIYFERMDDALRRNIGVPLQEAEKHDVARLFRAVEFDKFFPKEGSLKAYFNTLKSMDIDPEAGGRIKIDLEERASKTPRAFCAPIIIPEEIMLVIKPQGGVDDWMALFHEAGHSLHYGYTDPGLEVEYKRIGDMAVTETYAFLMEYLTHNPSWLMLHTHMERSSLSRFLGYQYLYKLFFLRRYSAKLRYEIELHSEKLARGRELYTTIMEDELGFRHPGIHYLRDIDDLFYSAQYLRAWMMEATLKRFLQEEYGSEWYHNRRAGEFLRSLWRLGDKPRGMDVLRTLIGIELDVRDLIRELKEGLDDYHYS